MTKQWKAIWLKKVGHGHGIGHENFDSKVEAKNHAMQKSDATWWQLLISEGDGWRPVENSLDMPKPITLRDVLEDEIKMRIICSQAGTAEQLKAIIHGFCHHYKWDGHKRFNQLVAYAYLEENQCLQDITGAMAARDMGIDDGLHSPILLISSRSSVKAVEGKMSRMQAGSWGNDSSFGHTHPPTGHTH